MVMSRTRLEAKLEAIGPWVILRLPTEASATLPSRGQVAIQGELKDHPFQAVLEPDGRRGHWLKLDEVLQRAVGARVGETVTLAVEPSKEWPEPEIPPDFSIALENAADIHDLWRSITPMARWEWIRWINATRSAATRHRRIDVSVSKLRAGKRRPCCFDLAACTDPDLSRNGVLLE